MTGRRPWRLRRESSSRLRTLGVLLRFGGLLVVVGAFVILQLSDDKIERFWVLAAAGLLTALVGAALLYLNPKGKAKSDTAVFPIITPTAERVLFADSLRRHGVTTEAEHRRQLRRILDEA